MAKGLLTYEEAGDASMKSSCYQMFQVRVGFGGS